MAPIDFTWWSVLYGAVARGDSHPSAGMLGTDTSPTVYVGAASHFRSSVVFVPASQVFCTFCSAPCSLSRPQAHPGHQCLYMCVDGSALPTDCLSPRGSGSWRCAFCRHRWIRFGRWQRELGAYNSQDTACQSTVVWPDPTSRHLTGRVQIPPQYSWTVLSDDRVRSKTYAGTVMSGLPLLRMLL